MWSAPQGRAGERVVGILTAVDDEWRLGETRFGADWSHELVFAEEVAWEREDLVAGMVEFLRTLPGVTAVDHVEREAVVVSAAGVPTGRLSAAVRRRWEEAKKERPPWMAAMDRAARMVEELTGFQRDGWRLTRVIDSELSHVITLDCCTAVTSTTSRCSVRWSPVGWGPPSNR